MDFLQVRNGKIVNTRGQPVQLRGTNLGGWMMMENFMSGYPGVESSLRYQMAVELGEKIAHFFFERLLDYFISPADLRFLKEIGMNHVRVPINYRHFENDEHPFEYMQAGFDRLDQLINWCSQTGLYVFIDLHAVQGYQNSDWHCDNSSRHSFFWHDKSFQDRYIALWEALASRYQGNPAIAGYSVMNEPLTGEFMGRFNDNHVPEWDVINRIYRRAVAAIRHIDPEHIICLEGDQFSVKFSGLDVPFADNLIYGSHNYNDSTFGPGAYPGQIANEYWDTARQKQVFLNMEGTQFSERHNVPLWISEFGPIFSGPPDEFPDRLRALQDQVREFEAFGAHWANWCYKDLGVMGLVNIEPQSEYAQVITPALAVKTELRTDNWMGWLPATQAVKQVHDLADLVEEMINYPSSDSIANHRYMTQHVLSNYVAHLIQPHFIRCFKGLNENRLDEILKSFAFDNCKLNQPLIDAFKVFLPKPDIQVK